VVYSPIAHWVWGGGWLFKMGALDFAGGTVVHVNAGVAALVAAMDRPAGERLLRRRRGQPSRRHRRRSGHDRQRQRGARGVPRRAAPGDRPALISHRIEREDSGPGRTPGPVLSYSVTVIEIASHRPSMVRC
jgi:hypothetical protein